MITLYLAGPFRGKDGYAVYQNVICAESFMHEITKASIEAGEPISCMCPHSMTFHLDRTFTDKYWLDSTMEWLIRSDAVFMLPSWQKSEGARGELEMGRKLGKPIFYTIPEVIIWAKEVQCNA
jgi:hypothetical protein